MQDKMAVKSSHAIGMTPNRHGQSPQRIDGKVFRPRLKPDKISGTQKIAGQSPNKTGMTPKIVGLKPIHWESTEHGARVDGNRGQAHFRTLREIRERNLFSGVPRRSEGGEGNGGPGKKRFALFASATA